MPAFSHAAAFGSLSQLPMASPPSAFSLYRVGLQGVIDGRQVRLWVWFRELRENGECALLFSFAFLKAIVQNGVGLPSLRRTMG